MMLWHHTYLHFMLGVDSGYGKVYCKVLDREVRIVSSRLSLFPD